MGRVSLIAVASLALAAAAAGAAPPRFGGTIVYSADLRPSVDGEVYRIGPDGRRIDLSRSPFDDDRPAASPDGGMVAFRSDRSGHPALYTVRGDGTHLRRVLKSVTYQADLQLAWSPDGSTLAVSAGGTGPVARSRLYLVRGGVARFARQVDGPEGLAWTPDGRMFTYVDGVHLVAVDASSGRTAWSRPLQHPRGTWTANGLFAGIDTTGRVRVYDTAGRLRFSFAGLAPQWSFDGALLASVSHQVLEVRDPSGAVVRRTRLPRLGEFVNGVLWRGARSVFVSGSGAQYRVDVTTGRATRDAGQFPSISAANGSIAWPTRDGARFAIHVATASWRRSHVAGHVPGCGDDGVRIPAVDSLQPVENGRALVYASYCKEPLANLWAISGGRTTRLTSASKQQVDAALSPDGSQIAWSQSDATGLSCKGCPSTIWVANADGTQARQLTHETEWFDTSPTWSPDGTTILYQRSSATVWGRLWTVPVRGGVPTDTGIDGAWPAWGKTSIAFDVQTSSRIVVSDPTGKNRRDTGATGVDATWSADGRLAFVRSPSAIGIWDGRATRRIPLAGAQVIDVAWSPDGTSLAVVAKMKGTAAFDIYVVNADGKAVTRVTRDVDALSVSWR